jgi:hypothetical protein
MVATTGGVAAATGGAAAMTDGGAAAGPSTMGGITTTDIVG